LRRARSAHTQINYRRVFKPGILYDGLRIPYGAHLTRSPAARFIGPPEFNNREDVMWKSFWHFLTGIAFIAISAYFLAGTAQGGKSLWHKEIASLEHTSPGNTSGSASGNPDTSAAQLHAYGVLSSANEGNGSDASPSQSTGPLTALDRVPKAESNAPQQLPHGRFSVKYFQSFSFIVPAHAIRPRVSGAYEALGAANASETNGEFAGIGTLLLDEQEFSDFIHHRPGTATFSQDPTTGAQIDWALVSDLHLPKKYYLVFRNPSRHPRNERVTADFTLTFD
jgi:hypothetical protein